MTAEQLKEKYPDSISMIDNLARECGLSEIRGNRTIHKMSGEDEGKYYYNYEGVHIRVFPSLEMLIKWFYDSPEEEAEAEATIVEYSYSSYLSKIADGEVFLDKDHNVAFCDFKNSDFTEKQLKTAKKLD